MSITLAFDTCLDKMYVTLADGEKILDSRIVVNHDEKYHSAFLISTIKDVLKSNGFDTKDINLIATNIGPGSFTGLGPCHGIIQGGDGEKAGTGAPACIQPGIEGERNETGRHRCGRMARREAGQQQDAKPDDLPGGTVLLFQGLAERDAPGEEFHQFTAA